MTNEQAEQRVYDVTQRQQITVEAKLRVRAGSEAEAYEAAAARAPELVNTSAGEGVDGALRVIDRVVNATMVDEQPDPEERYWIVTTRDTEVWRSTWRILARSGQEAAEKVESGDYISEQQLTNDYEETPGREVTGTVLDANQSEG